MDDAAARAAAELLLASWQGGTRIKALPQAIRPASRREGYAVQAALQSLSGDTLQGWKIAATSPAGQAHIGVDGPLAGRLLASRVQPSGSVLALTRNHMRVAEPEFAFCMARDLLSRSEPYTQDEVLAAAGTLHPALEVPDSRFEDFARVGAAQLIADNACAALFRTRQRGADGLAEAGSGCAPGAGRGQWPLRPRRQGRQCAGRSAGGLDLARQRIAGAGHGTENGTGSHDWNLHDALGARGRRSGPCRLRRTWHGRGALPGLTRMSSRAEPVITRRDQPLRPAWRFYPKSFPMLILAGFALAVLPLIFALINNALSIHELASKSQRAVINAVQVTQSTRLLIEQITGMERGARQFAILADPELYSLFETAHRDFAETARRMQTLRSAPRPAQHPQADGGSGEPPVCRRGGVAPAAAPGGGPRRRLQRARAAGPGARHVRPRGRGPRNHRDAGLVRRGEHLHLLAAGGPDPGGAVPGIGGDDPDPQADPPGGGRAQAARRG